MRVRFSTTMVWRGGSFFNSAGAACGSGIERSISSRLTVTFSEAISEEDPVGSAGMSLIVKVLRDNNNKSAGPVSRAFDPS